MLYNTNMNWKNSKKKIARFLIFKANKIDYLSNAQMIRNDRLSSEKAYDNNEMNILLALTNI